MQSHTKSSSQPCQLEHALSIVPVSPSTRDATVQTLPAPTLCEDSSQTRQLERAPPTGSKPCAIIVSVSLSTHDNAIQKIKIKTSAGSADVTTQSASSADSTKTPGNSATTEMQKYMSEYEAQLKLHEAQLIIQEAIIHLYGNGPYNHNQKEAIFKLRLSQANCREIQALEIEKLIEKGALLDPRRVAGSTDASDSPIRADAGSPAAGPIPCDSEFKASTSNFPPPGKYGIRPSRKAIQLAKEARKLARHSNFTGSAPKGGCSNAFINNLLWQMMDKEHPEKAQRLWWSFSKTLARGRPCLHAAEYDQFLRNRMAVEQQRNHLEQIQSEKEQREHTDRVRQQSERTQQKPISQAPISTPLKPHTSPDGGRGYSIPLAQEARKLNAIKKTNETRKRNQQTETKRVTKITTHASTPSSALAKVKEDEPSEKSIEMPDRKSQPSKSGICKEAFMSRNALFKHPDEKHQFCREWQQQPKVEEKTSPRACDGSYINLCPAASSWQIQCKGRSSSVVSKLSNALA